MPHADGTSHGNMTTCGSGLTRHSHGASAVASIAASLVNSELSDKTAAKATTGTNAQADTVEGTQSAGEAAASLTGGGGAP